MPSAAGILSSIGYSARVLSRKWSQGGGGASSNKDKAEGVSRGSYLSYIAPGPFPFSLPRNWKAWLPRDCNNRAEGGKIYKVFALSLSEASVAAAAIPLPSRQEEPPVPSKITQPNKRGQFCAFVKIHLFVRLLNHVPYTKKERRERK